MLSLVYPLKLSITSGIDANPDIHFIADIQVLRNDTSLELLVKNSNRAYLAGSGSRAQTSLIPWLGALHNKQVHSNEYYKLFRVIELLWEMRTVGYPDNILHKLAYWVPASTLAHRLRRFITLWIQTT